MLLGKLHVAEVEWNSLSLGMGFAPVPSGQIGAMELLKVSRGPEGLPLHLFGAP